MRLVLRIVVLVALCVGTQALPFAPLSPGVDHAGVVLARTSNPHEICTQMMRMRREMMGRRMTCKQMMRMHRKMMDRRM